MNLPLQAVFLCLKHKAQTVSRSLGFYFERI